MAEVLQLLGELGDAVQPATPEAPVYVQKLDKQGRAYATGKRKNAVARVWIKPGPGRIVVNNEEARRGIFRAAGAAHDLASAAHRCGPRDAIRCHDYLRRGACLRARRVQCVMGFPEALTHFEPELRSVLKRIGFLTRNSRVVERKKYGRAKARRRFQFSKALIAPTRCSTSDLQKAGLGPPFLYPTLARS